MKKAGKKVGKALGIGGEEPAAEPVKAAPAVKPADAPTAKTITSTSPDAELRLRKNPLIRAGL